MVIHWNAVGSLFSDKPIFITFWLFNIAMGNGPFIVDFPIKKSVFHSYVSLPEGRFLFQARNSGETVGKRKIEGKNIMEATSRKIGKAATTDASARDEAHSMGFSMLVDMEVPQNHSFYSVACDGAYHSTSHPTTIRWSEYS